MQASIFQIFGKATKLPEMNGLVSKQHTSFTLTNKAFSLLIIQSMLLTSAPVISFTLLKPTAVVHLLPHQLAWCLVCLGTLHRG